MTAMIASTSASVASRRRSSPMMAIPKLPPPRLPGWSSGSDHIDAACHEPSLHPGKRGEDGKPCRSSLFMLLAWLVDLPKLVKDLRANHFSSDPLLSRDEFEDGIIAEPG